MIDLHMHPIGLTDRESHDHFARTGRVPKEALKPLWDALKGVERAVVLSLVAPRSGIDTSNDLVAEVVRHDPNRLVGFASVDPHSPTALRELDRGILELGLRGVKLAPIYQQFDPVAPEVWPLYERIQCLGVPTMWHQGTSFLVREGPLEYARPFLLDRVARAFPGMKMVIAHCGYPWSGEVVALVRKHASVYTDISVLAGRPWFLYNALVAAMEYDATDKILLGSDYPASTARETVSALEQINDLVRGTGLPRIPEKLIREIVERDSMDILGIG